MPTEKKSSNNFKIIDLVSNVHDYQLIMRNLFSMFRNDMLIVNGSFRFVRKEKDADINLLKTFLLKFGISDIPFISPNLISNQQEDEILIGGYKSVINNSGDFSFFNNQNKYISWNSELDFIKLRSNDNTFLIDEEKNNFENLHYAHLIITRYLFNDSKALHINYIVKKKGVNDNSIKAFIRFVNFVKNLVNKNNIFYFSVAGNANINSAKWQKIIYKIFNNSCYVSPGIESNFITDIDNKYGARSNRFIFMSKEMAPYGVYFYLTQQKIDRLSSSNILVAEILKSEKYEKNINDDTKNIYEGFLKEKRVNPSLILDLESSNDVDLSKFDMNEIGVYKPYPIKIKT